MNRILVYIAVLFVSIEYVQAQATRAPEQSKSILLINGTAHLGTGKVYPKSLIGIKDGLIEEVYNANVVKYENLKYDTVIDVSGKHIYPGFIAPNSRLGLHEIDRVRASLDDRETGLISGRLQVQKGSEWFKSLISLRFQSSRISQFSIENF